MTQCRYDPSVVDAFLDHHWTYHPVDATFMGSKDHDGRLPPCGPETVSGELATIAALEQRLANTAEPAELGDRLDRRMMLAELALQKAAATSRSRLSNPAWYSGEAAFAIISLLLPQSAPVRQDSLVERLDALPAFLTSALERLNGQAVPDSWTARAWREAVAMAEFLRVDIRLHDEFSQHWTAPANAAADAFDAFASGLTGFADADPACGENYLSLLMNTIHGLDFDPREAVRRAEEAFDRIGDELVEMAKSIDPAKSWQELIAGLSDNHPADTQAVFESYRQYDVAARRDGAMLVMPAQEYGLEYRWMAPCFRKVSQSLYFLFYRSPPGLNPGQGSVYWVTPPGEDFDAFLRGNNAAIVKTIHSVHHGSVGHHTQNTRARSAQSRLARIAGTDCALGLAFLGSGTLIEGWACYVEDLLMEASGFYEPAEILLLKQYERRNAASVLVDVKLHLGDWSITEAMAFYRDKAGFAPARVEGEVVRNSMLPGSRLMYWIGVEGIKTLRSRWKGDTLSFHDALLSYGHVPLAWIAEEMQRAGQLN
ncbi:hypothetical protein QO002_005017 [Pararhizobium capsulatum DSM 1112]|uniref:DUF885 domain-containing protein n=1 Tax=Pararhizobium capsulatum DSM 1112 TaxID=1121113 RepID=A0ABU0BX20_9HYPH|nr:DUF885 family protein [Pararhizobium capsulatum]MDQ0322811.1 hypothetical protein [Pararhizobium capsulatum DSM 1112]